MATAVAGAGAVTGATAVAGIATTSVVKEIVAVVKDIGKLAIKGVVDIAKLFADPTKGLPVALVLYLGAKQVSIDVSSIEQQIDVTISQAKAFNFASRVDSSVKSWLATFLNIPPDIPFYELLNPVRIWNAINVSLPPVVDVIAKALLFIPVSLTIFILGTVVGFSYLAYYVHCILLDILAVMSKLTVRFFGTAINYLFQFVAWLVCSYIKVVQPLLPLALALRLSHRGLKSMLLASALGTITAYVALYTLAPECASIAIPGAQPTPAQPPALPAPGEVLAKVLKVDFEKYPALAIARLLFIVVGIAPVAVPARMLSIANYCSTAVLVRMVHTVVGVFLPTVKVT